MQNIKKLLKTKEYDYLRDNKSLGSNIILLAAGGSIAYGTNIESSDVDIRGCALNSKKEILLQNGFEQIIDKDTDTVIYSLHKLIRLLSNCNPNVIEILGCRPEHYYYKNEIGQLLLDNSHLFLSQKAIRTFGGYANQQLRRLENATIRDLEQSKREQHIYKTIEYAFEEMQQRYTEFSDIDEINLFIDESKQEEYDTEIFADIVLKHYPLRDYVGIVTEMQSIVRSYNKIGKRNQNAFQHNKIGKHMMHLIRLYYMCIDILEKEKIITYREDEHDLLMDIRNNKYLNKDGVPIPEFYDLLHELENRLDEAKKNTALPKKVDMKMINQLELEISEKVVKGE